MYQNEKRKRCKLKRQEHRSIEIFSNQLSKQRENFHWIIYLTQLYLYLYPTFTSLLYDGWLSLRNANTFFNVKVRLTIWSKAMLYNCRMSFFILSFFVGYILFSLIRLRTIQLSARVRAHIGCRCSRSHREDVTITDVIIKTPDRK